MRELGWIFLAVFLVILGFGAWGAADQRNMDQWSNSRRRVGGDGKVQYELIVSISPEAADALDQGRAEVVIRNK